MHVCMCSQVKALVHPAIPPPSTPTPTQSDVLQGIVHRDIKSENVFRTAAGVWKLGDFGSSLRLGDGRSLARQAIKLEGTFSFAAPEYIAIWHACSREQLTQATTLKVRLSAAWLHAGSEMGKRHQGALPGQVLDVNLHIASTKQPLLLLCPPCPTPHLPPAVGQLGCRGTCI